MEFKDLLKEIRTKNRHSLRDLENKTGVKFTYFNKIEKGLKNPSETVIQALFKVYPSYKNKIAKAYIPTKVAPFILEEIDTDELDKIMVIFKMLDISEQKIILKSILEKVAFSAYKKGNIDEVEPLLNEVEGKIEKL